MTVRGVRGATTALADTAEAIVEAARELLVALVEANGITPEGIASVIFTTTPDLTAEFPARAARSMGPAWSQVPLLGAQEMPCPGGPPRCIRILVHWNTDRTPEQIRHVYLRGARGLRPDHGT